MNTPIHVVSDVTKIDQNPSKTEEKPSTTTYFRKLISNCAKIAKPLTDLTWKGQNNDIAWAPAQEQAFTALNTILSLVRLPLCKRPTWQNHLSSATSASNISIGAVLLMLGNAAHASCCSASHNLLPREIQYPTIEWEYLTLVWAVEKYYWHLCSKPIVIQCDHQPLQYLHSAKYLNRVLRWNLLLQYSFCRWLYQRLW